MERIVLAVITLIVCTQMLFGQSFDDKASDLGIDYCYDTVYLFAGGISTVDFNKDGFDDLSIATGPGEEPKFYAGNGIGFTPVGWSIEDTSVHTSIVWVDYDNDEDYDLFITGYGFTSRLYKNNGSFSFSDVTASAGLSLDDRLSVGSAWGDLDHDGYLDLYVYNYDYDEDENFFYRNQGDGTFEDETNTWKVGNGNLLTLAAGFFDYDGDSNIDLFVANDARLGNETNSIYWNDNLESCMDKIEESGMTVSIFSMNAGIGDFDRDGDFDIYVTNHEPKKAFLWQKHNSGPFYINEAENYEVGFNGVSWGGNFFDYDNDMDLDLYVCNSYTGEVHKNALFENNMPNPYFLEISNDGREADTVTSWCNAIFDYNNDGLLDIAVNNACPFDYAIWKNNTNTNNNYIKIKLKGDISNADAIGSTIEVISGGISQFKFTQCGEAFQAQNSYRHHFGLADESTVDTIRVTFPSGIVGYVYDTSANIVVTIDEQDFALAHTKLVLQQEDDFLSWKWDGTGPVDKLILEKKEGFEDFETVEILAFTEEGKIKIPAYSSPNPRSVFRLKAMDNSEVRIYSNAVSIENPIFAFSPFPNLVACNQAFQFHWISNSSEEMEFVLVDVQGGLVESRTIVSEIGENYILLDQGLDCGQYFLKLSTLNGARTVVHRLYIL